ncbi:MAG: hypothetical protein ACI3XQ_09095 [Eubacteriales bacterium]
MAEVNKVNLRLITRLVESDITSEKAVMALKLKDILSIPGITKQELTAICDLQDAIKAGSILAFLAVPEAKEIDKESTDNET